MLSRYEFMVNSISDTMSVINPKHCYEAVNDSWCFMLGQARESVIGRPLWEVWGKERYKNYIAPQLLRVFAEGTPLTHQATVEYPAIGIRECLITYFPCLDAQQRVSFAVVVTRDISELEAARQAMIAARDAAESASKAKSEFLANMSHELRTPLNAIIGFSQLLKADKHLHYEHQTQVHEIARAGEHLLSLVNDLLDLSRIEAGKVLDFSPEAVNIKSVASDSLSIVTPLAQQFNISLSDDISPENGTAVQGDYSRLRQILINLLSNAIKYNRPGGSVTLSCRNSGDQLRISVADTGKGIPPEKQARLFTAFDRLDEEGGISEGTGIGLVITQRLVQAMGGSIGFESNLDSGSTFWIDLLLATACDSPAGSPEDEEINSTTSWEEAPGSGQHLLLAEDNPTNQKLAQALLRKLGYTLDIVNNGSEALTAALSGNYALLLMDCQMPVMDGYEATSAIRLAEQASGRHLPIVAMTANVLEKDLKRCLTCGMDDYVIKPIDVRKLSETLKKFLRPSSSDK